MKPTTAWPAGLALLALLLACVIGLSCRSTAGPQQSDGVTLQLDAVPLLLKADSAAVSTIWATVLQSGHPVQDSTMVVFAASQGQVTPEAYTRDGLAMATFTPPSEPGVAEVVAQVKAVRDTVLVTVY